MSQGTRQAMSEAPEETAWRVPGRVEVLGKHTDYAGGSVLVGAIDRAITARARRVTGPPASLTATTDGGDPVTLRAGVDPGLEPGHWGRYLQTVLDRLTLNFGVGTAAHLSISSDLPPASGMSSSSALVCATALALASLNGWDADPRWIESMPDRLSLAGYLAAVEGGRAWRDLPGTSGVGTRGGSEDHTGMLCGAQDRLLLADFDPMCITRTISFPSQWALVVGVTGVLAHKTGAALEDYNRGPNTVQAVLARWNEATGRTDASLAGAVKHLIGDATGEQAAGDPALKDLLRLCDPGYERQRIEQFLVESLVLVPDGARLIAAADPGMGEVLERSQELADRGLRNQVPQTRLMVSLAREAGAIGASSFGAGWGGSVYALVPADDAEDFAPQWLQTYRDRAPEAERAATIVTRPGPGACRLP
ncbi:galactokinase family protein [uncultured Actinomyces sp.]|uniref:galactokinase family protein n=1 Tax=uncultured Actinomyces sp. TaxID=249061 RepID=UPI0028D72063|nr:galactokinase family protein [uncultured Actinomyces sp.]